MGCCLSNHNQHDAIIQNIIEQTVFEQQQIQIEEGQQERIRTTLNSDQEIINSDDSKKQYNVNTEHHVKNSSHHKREFEKVDERNYLLKVEYNVKIKQFIVELIKLDTSSFYKIQISASFLDFEIMVDLKGIQVNDNHQHLQLYPFTYQEAVRHARYNCFFSNDKYFNIEESDFKKQHFFQQLLLVQRQVLKSHQKSTSSQEKRVVNRRWAMIADLATVLIKQPNITNRSKAEVNYDVVNELMEVIQVFDIETNPRFLNIIFHLMLQTYFPHLREYLVYIEEVYFLFHDLPHLDCPQYYKILLFYQGMNYSLKDLHTHLDFEQLQLSDLCLLKLTYCLLKILYSCYSKYLYRLNFTLSNIYYFRRLKVFKLQSFQRISSLIPFQADVESSVNCISESKISSFRKCYLKDYLAICDIIILFKNPRGQNQRTISKLRKKKVKSEKELRYKDYLLYADSIFDEVEDRIILDFIKIGLNRSLLGNDYNIEQALEDLKSIITQMDCLILSMEQLQKQRKKDEYLLKKQQKKNQNEFEDIIDISSQSEEEDQENILKNFDLELDIENLTIKQMENKENTDIQREQLKNEMNYSSLLMNRNFLRNCQNFLKKEDKYSIDKVQALIYLAQAKSQEIVDENIRKQQFQNDLEPAIQLVQKHDDKSMSTSHFLVLIQLMQYSTRKPQVVLLRLLQISQLQQQKKFLLRRKIKKAIHSQTGLIEMRKHVIIQLANVEHCLANSRLNEANSMIFSIIDIQMKRNLLSSLLFGYSLYIYGIICQETIQIQSAMITFQMSKTIYDNYFPMEKWIEIKENQQEEHSNKKAIKEQKQKDEPEKHQRVLINFHNMATYNLSKLAYDLGVVFCQLNDPENALKALQKAIEYRKLIHDEFSDEVIEIVLMIFKIYIENEESSQVLKLGWFYARKINQLYRDNKLQCLHNKNFAQLEFLLAGVFQNCNSYFSALRFYSRASKAYTVSKTQTFNRMYFVQQQRKLIMSQIKDYHLHNDRMQSQEFYYQTKVRSIYDKMKPFFQQVYFVSSILYMDNSLNQKTGTKLLHSNGFMKNNDFQLASQRYQEIHKQYSQIQKDECYGHNIEKIGEIFLEQGELEKAKTQFEFAIGIYEKYLFFPYKEYCQMRCYLYIICILAIQKQSENLIKQFNLVDTFIQDCQQFMKWSIIQEERKYNKFQLLSKKAGVKILYQLVELMDLIDKFRNVRKRWFKKIQDLDYINQRGQKMKKRMKIHRSENKLLAEFRKSCLLGNHVSIRIRKYEDQIKVNQDDLQKLQDKRLQEMLKVESINQNEDQRIIEQSILGQKTLQEQENIPQQNIKSKKSKFFILDIDENTIKKKKQKQINEQVKKIEISQQTSSRYLDLASSTLESQRTQPPSERVLKIQKSKSSSKATIIQNFQDKSSISQRGTSQKICKLNPFQKVSKKQI
ncbi:unnamed protein product [Paramecium primaurelia]|uniref:Tetratricopeptide repeat protein n=1 Tax=Paramecium primaurelia TaxID=5886 RepID=A0A8S1LQ68_PARPR|nr:unnamed protein product [Paramecium primaurelia]